MTVIKTYEEGGVQLDFYSYRSLHSDIIVEALTTAIPEAEGFKNEVIVASWKWFLVTVSCLTNVKLLDKKTATEDEAFLFEFWKTASECFSAGDWKTVWKTYSLLSYDMQFLITKGYNATRREALGLTDKDIAGADAKSPK